MCVVVGPVVAEAMFVNREEIPVYPVYRDPVSFLDVSFSYCPMTLSVLACLLRLLVLHTCNLH